MKTSKSGDREGEQFQSGVTGAGQLQRAEDRERGVPGKEQIVAHAVGHQQGGNAGLVPDLARRIRKAGETLVDLAQGEDQDQSEERPDALPEEGRANEEEAERVDARGTGDEQRVAGRGVVLQPGIPARGPVMEGVADAVGARGR